MPVFLPYLDGILSIPTHILLYILYNTTMYNTTIIYTYLDGILCVPTQRYRLLDLRQLPCVRV
jgi:hypothetical protein